MDHQWCGSCSNQFFCVFCRFFLVSWFLSPKAMNKDSPPQPPSLRTGSLEKWLALWFGAILVAQMVKYLPAMREMQIRSLGWEDALKKGMATHSSILAWRIPWTEEPGGLQSTGWDTTERLTLFFTWSHLGGKQATLKVLFNKVYQRMPSKYNSSH